MANPLTLSPARTNAPLHAPSDVRLLLAGFELTVADLLTTSNPKLTKTTGARSVIHHALPHRSLALALATSTVGSIAPRGHLPGLLALAKRHGMVDRAMRHNGCRFATPGCVAACLNHAGHGGLTVAVPLARGRRTLAMVADPVTYARAMVWAIAREYANAARDGLPLAFRLCGTDETPWHRMGVSLSHAETRVLHHRFGVDALCGNNASVADAFAPMVADGRMVPYEYLKAPVDHADGPDAWLRAGWSDITASFAADRLSACADAVRAIDAGFRLAVPVAWPKAAPLPTIGVITLINGTTRTVRCVDGDRSDARWMDPSPCMVLLREKRARGADARSRRFILAHRHRHTLADGRLDLG